MGNHGTCYIGGELETQLEDILSSQTDHLEETYQMNLEDTCENGEKDPLLTQPINIPRKKEYTREEGMDNEEDDYEKIRKRKKGNEMDEYKCEDEFCVYKCNECTAWLYQNILGIEIDFNAEEKQVCPGNLCNFRCIEEMGWTIKGEKNKNAECERRNEDKEEVQNDQNKVEYNWFQNEDTENVHMKEREITEEGEGIREPIIAIQIEEDLEQTIENYLEQENIKEKEIGDIEYFERIIKKCEIFEEHTAEYMEEFVIGENIEDKYKWEEFDEICIAISRPELGKRMRETRIRKDKIEEIELIKLSSEIAKAKMIDYSKQERRKYKDRMEEMETAMEKMFAKFRISEQKKGFAENTVEYLRYELDKKELELERLESNATTMYLELNKWKEITERKEEEIRRNREENELLLKENMDLRRKMRKNKY